MNYFSDKLLIIVLFKKMYPSMKPLASWTRDLIQRVDQLEKWSSTAHAPHIFWMSGFTFPTGFLTAVLQTSARLYNVIIFKKIHSFTSFFSLQNNF